MINLSCENRFVLSCIQGGIAGNKINKSENIISRHLNWDNVLDSASWHGIAPLLYKRLNSYQGCNATPQHIMDRLKEAYYANLARNMYLFGKLKEILNAFHEKGLNVIVLKGAALAHTVYDDIGTRPMSDIDLLLRRDALPDAERILSGSGYLFKGNRTPEWWRDNHYHIEYRHPETNVKIELHWGIASAVNPNHIRITDTGLMNRWRERALAADISGVTALVLSPEDLLFYLCVHFFKHRFYGSTNGGFTSRGALIQLYDIYLTLKQYSKKINWDVLMNETEQYGLDGLIYSTLLLVREIIGFKGHIHRYTRKDKTRFDVELIELLKKKIFIREDKLPLVPGNIIQSFREGTFQNGIKKLLRDVIPSPEIMSKKYSVSVSSKKLYFYYALRPFDILLRHGRIISEIPRIKDDAILNRWIHS